MKRILIYSLALSSLALAGCQKAKMQSVRGNPTVTSATPPGNPQPPIYVPPTHIPDDSDGTILQPPEPPIYEPPVRPPTVRPPTVYVPPTSTDFPVRPLPPPPAPIRNEQPVPPRRPPAPVTVDWEVTPLPPLPVAMKPCEGAGCGTQMIEPPANECPENAPSCGLPPPQKDVKCEAAPYMAKAGQPALDILFVVDTSLSLRGGAKRNAKEGELAKLARGMESFVAQLDQNTSYRIGVMLGHGPQSRHHARLFSSGSNDPEVIDYSTYYNREKSRGGSEEEIRARVGKKIGQILENKMIAIPNDSSQAQGEAMMLSLYKSITDGSRRGGIEKDGLFRKGVPLNVIFMSDEQDVCFDYAGTGYEPVKKLRQIKDKKGKVTETEVIDPSETAFFNNVCAKAVSDKKTGKRYPLTTGHVFDALNSLKQDDGFMVQAVAYTNSATVAARGIEDENELGHGIIDLVKMAQAGGNGISVDLASVDRSQGFAREMTFMGSATQAMMTYPNQFFCTITNYHPASIDPMTVRMRLLDDSGAEIATYSSDCRRTKSCGSQPYLKMVLAENKDGSQYAKFSVAPYSSLGNVMKAKKATKGTYQISFDTRPEIEARTGNYVPGYKPSTKSKLSIADAGAEAQGKKTKKTKKN